MSIARTITLCCMLLGTIVSAQQSPQNAVLKATGDWLTSISAGNRAALNRIMDDRFIATTPEGDVLKKERLVPNDELLPVQRLPRFELDTPVVRIYGDIGVVMSRLKAAPPETPMNATFIYQKQGSAWKLVALHLSSAN